MMFISSYSYHIQPNHHPDKLFLKKIKHVFNLCISKFKEFNVLHGGPLNPKSDKIVSREFPLKLNVFLGGSLILKWEKMLSREFLRNWTSFLEVRSDTKSSMFWGVAKGVLDITSVLASDMQPAIIICNSCPAGRKDWGTGIGVWFFVSFCREDARVCSRPRQSW